MSKFSKLILKLMQGHSDRNVDFDELRKFMKRLGFDERIKGSHHIFFKHDVEEIINLQPDTGSKAKPYQVKQVREIIIKYAN
jgi:predicted RNA binding protein YcfA (HicA-like mRNA interferase family)